MAVVEGFGTLDRNLSSFGMVGVEIMRTDFIVPGDAAEVRLIECMMGFRS